MAQEIHSMIGSLFKRKNKKNIIEPLKNKGLKKCHITLGESKLNLRTYSDVKQCDCIRPFSFDF